MNHLVTINSPTLPALVTAAGERASTRFLEFSAANIRNPAGHYRAAEEFLAWCASVRCSNPVIVLGETEGLTRVETRPLPVRS
jgi:hypothetical protein